MNNYYALALEAQKEHNSKKSCSKRLTCKADRKQDRALRDMKRGGKRNLWASVEA